MGGTYRPGVDEKAVLRTTSASHTYNGNICRLTRQVGGYTINFCAGKA